VQAIPRVQRKEQWEKAMRGPHFLKNLEAVEVHFKFADAETARIIG
jgi:hypothetical protein